MNRLYQPNRWRIAFAIASITLWFAFANMADLVLAQKVDKSVPKKQRAIALGENEVRQLLTLMDTDKSGKISKKEFMSFMEAEFDRLDTDKSGELDVKELTRSQVRSSRPAAGK